MVMMFGQLLKDPSDLVWMVRFVSLPNSVILSATQNTNPGEHGFKKEFTWMYPTGFNACPAGFGLAFVPSLLLLPFFLWSGNVRYVPITPVYVQSTEVCVLILRGLAAQSLS